MELNSMDIVQNIVGSTMNRYYYSREDKSINPQLEEGTGGADMKIMEVIYSMHSRSE
jgi:hypothetical protein